jgi:hypothetical protein
VGLATAPALAFPLPLEEATIASKISVAVAKAQTIIAEKDTLDAPVSWETTIHNLLEGHLSSGRDCGVLRARPR